MSALHPGPLPMRLVLMAAGGVAMAGLVALLAMRPAESPVPASAHVHAEAAAGAGAVPGDRPKSEVTTVSCQVLPNAPGQSMTLQTVVYPPNAFTPAHRHPGSVTAFVLYGTVRSQLEGGPVGTFGPGSSWFEPPRVLHDFAENASTREPAAILAIQVADSDCGPLLIPER